jgi:hypothetical protein
MASFQQFPARNQTERPDALLAQTRQAISKYNTTCSEDSSLENPELDSRKYGKAAEEEELKKWCGREDSNLHGIATASPSSWCVCQFRHYRTSTTF